MSMNGEVQKPSLPTVKRLFAVSGNLCAFPKCTTPLIDPQSGSVLGQICHIKGNKSGSARYDPAQTNENRREFANLILLCNLHHKIVDDDEIAYTDQRLFHMKQEHESRHPGPSPVDEATAERFASVAITNCTIHGPVITSHSQVGGQTAHTIINNYVSTPKDEAVKLEGKLETGGDLKLINEMGCPGMCLTVICRGERAAKIQSAHLLIDDVDVMGGMREGFATDFNYTPMKGSTQTMDVSLIALSRPNSQAGHVLSRDDVVRFFYPLPMPPTMLVLQAKPENVSMVVKYFDGSEQVLLAGQHIKDVLQGVFHVFQNRPGHINVPIVISVRVKSSTPPGPDTADLIGKVNPNYVSFVPPISHRA